MLATHLLSTCQPSTYCIHVIHMPATRHLRSNTCGVTFIHLPIIHLWFHCHTLANHAQVPVTHIIKCHAKACHTFATCLPHVCHYCHIVTFSLSYALPSFHFYITSSLFSVGECITDWYCTCPLPLHIEILAFVCMYNIIFYLFCQLCRPTASIKNKRYINFG